jgi:FtsP/CotA-like multicopper oxidase with cupredoxin domain
VGAPDSEGEATMRFRHPARVALIGVAALALAITGCDSSGGSKAAPSTTTTTVADPSHLGHSTTTPAAGGIVETSFPTVQGRPLTEPPVIRSQNGLLQTTFDVHEAIYDVGGQQVKGKTYGPGILGPTLIVDPGDTIEIELQNHLSEVTNFHTHGLHTSPIGVSDNVLRVMPANSDDPVRIEVPTDVAPGTYWYHAHLHGLTEEQVFSGLAGTLIVNGLTERLPADLQGVTEHLLALRDVQLDDDGTIITKNINSDAPTTRTVNGQVNPIISGVANEAMLLRVGDLSADIWYRLRLDGATFTVLAEDANPMGRVETRDELLLPPGKRFDVLVRFPKPGSYRLRTLRYSTGPAGDTYPARVLATFAITSGNPDRSVPALPTTMGELPDLGKDPIAVHRNVVFSENNKGFYINGKQFDAKRVTFSPKLGTTEEWTIHNVTKEEHPFHIHVNDFQVMSINGKKVDADSLRDTLPLPVGGTVVIRMRFTQFLGRYVFHCHILAHEDGGMMAVVDVTKDGKPSPAPTTDVTGPMPGM